MREYMSRKKQSNLRQTLSLAFIYGDCKIYNKWKLMSLKFECIHADQMVGTKSIYSWSIHLRTNVISYDNNNLMFKIMLHKDNCTLQNNIVDSKVQMSYHRN